MTNPSDVVWESKLDGQYDVKVVRIIPYQGKLTIHVNGIELYSQEVGISYDAPFGPDAGDVQLWEEITMNYVDGKDAKPA